MSFTDQLVGYRKTIDTDVAHYCRTLLAETEQTYGRHAKEATSALTAILGRGGKRIRGSLVMASYELLGGTSRPLALRIARATEVVHAYLLLLDDVVDRSTLRRGGPTAHLLMCELHQTRDWRGDAAHFGNSIAITAGMLGVSLAETIIYETRMAATKKLHLLQSLHGNLKRTVQGQLCDIWNEVLPQVSEQEALQVAELKTAYYTFVNPLETGAILADASPETIAQLREYGLKAGIAFQIIDDIIGIFSPAEKSGKSAMDDIIEGKMTILMTHALQHASATQRHVLLKTLGRANIDEATFTACQEIITDTGALAHAEKMAAQYADKALGTLAKGSLPAGIRQFLEELVQYIVARRA